MPRILHIADIHLGARPLGFSERSSGVVEAFRQALEYAVTERVDLVLIAGDLFDVPKPEGQYVKEAVRAFKALSSRGVRIIAAHGEHDTPGRRSSTMLEVLDEAVDGFHAPQPPRGVGIVEAVEATTITVKGVTIAVFPFFRTSLAERRRIAGALLEAYDRRLAGAGGTSVFLGHFSLDSVQPFDYIASPGSLPRAMYAALGHVHRRSLDLEAPVPYAYPGSLQPLNVDEAGHEFKRGPLLVDLEGDMPRVEELPVDTPDHVFMDLDLSAKRSSITPVIKNAVARAAVKAGRGGVIILRVVADPTVPPRLVYNTAVEAGRSHGVLVKVILERGIPGMEGKSVKVSAFVSPGDVMRHELKIPEGAVEALLDLQRAVLDGDDDAVLEALDRLASYRSLVEKWAGVRR